MGQSGLEFARNRSAAQAGLGWKESYAARGAASMDRRRIATLIPVAVRRRRRNAVGRRGGTTPRIATTAEAFDGQTVIKREVLPDGRTKLILKYSASGGYADRIVAGD